LVAVVRSEGVMLLEVLEELHMNREGYFYLFSSASTFGFIA
jgi:hypothetical protein